MFLTNLAPACIQVLGEVVENQEQPPKALRRPTGRRLTLIYEAWIRARRCPSNHLESKTSKPQSTS
ncbi:hypothetical protein KC19_11G160500 [Ceratodon purpureus]|uniref:Uncharacterized protein n=1 Tax=Ceratodon purpureus TaxID=3225 RepID=A0A8T0GFQ1_CERPU|nr:hypothetical protein KC19_N030500 [Ceratodon purpureus]KAG0557833.1 hypothetical protein KC19_11G160500 [Ceratodon purpureus]